MNRRLVIVLAPLVAALGGDHGFGPLPRKPLPQVVVTNQDGGAFPLPELVRGKAVAVQFIFSNCATACPLLGSTFGAIEKRLGQDAGAWMLLSVSVDPGRDGPQELKRWLQRHHAGARWQAITAAPADTAQILAAFGQKQGPVNGHSAQIFFVDKSGRVVSRTTPLPDPDEVAAELKLRGR